MSVFDGVVLGKHTLSSGKESNVKFVIERAIETTSDRNYVTQLLLDNAVYEIPQQEETLAGVETGGVVCATLLASYGGPSRRVITISKDFVPSRGPRHHKERVLVVDDVISTGASIQQAKEALTEAGFNCVGHTFVIDRRNMGSEY